MQFLSCLQCLLLAVVTLCGCEDERYLDVNGKPMPDNGKMIQAVVIKDLATIKKLHAKGVPLTSSWIPGTRTPLHWAAATGGMEIIDYLLDNGVDPNITGADGGGSKYNTPLHESTYHERIDVARVLLARGAKVDGIFPPGNEAITPYMEAASWHKIAMCKFLLGQGADGTYTNCYGDNALTCAMDNAYPPLELIKLTVEAGANPNTIDSVDMTPLMKAALLNRKDIYEYLLSVGADPTYKDPYGNTPVDYAQGKAYPRKNFHSEPYVEDGRHLGIPFR